MTWFSYFRLIKNLVKSNTLGKAYKAVIFNPWITLELVERNLQNFLFFFPDHFPNFFTHETPVHLFNTNFKSPNAIFALGLKSNSSSSSRQVETELRPC